MNTPIPPRNQVPLEQTWNTASIFPTREAWLSAFQEVEQRIPSIKRYEGHLSDSPQMLAEAFDATQSLLNQTDLVGLYARLNNAVDTTDQAAKADADRVNTLHSKVRAAVAFLEPELLKIGFPKLREWIKTEPKLAVYAHYIDRLERNAPHVRSAEVEEVLSRVQDPFRTASQTHGVLVNADLKFKPAYADGSQEPVEVAHSSIAHLLSSRDRALRKSAWESYADAHLAFKNTQANALAAGVKQDAFFARSRSYASSLEAALAPNALPLEVFHNLIDTFRANLPTWRRYWDLHRTALKLDQVHVYDTRAALSEDMPAVPFEQGVEWICAGMAPLGEEYVSILRRGVLDERWVDRAVNVGKRFGAFSSGVKGSHPFINMSYNDDIFSVSTLAHELGHSMHSWYSRGTQPYIYSNYGTFLAEVASNFNQAMVRAWMLEHLSDRSLQIAIIEEAMNNFHRYFFIMPTLARFELELHDRIEKGQALSSKGMIDLMADLFAEGYGPDVVVDRERVGSTWMQFSTHMYMNFYVFQYATGISGAHALVNAVLKEGEPARQRYIEFLKSGGSRYPLGTLQTAGVDLTTPQPVQETFQLMSAMIDKLEKLV